MTIPDQIKNSVNISQVFARHTSIKPTGNGSFLAKCLFHSEKTPSCHVNDNKGFYYCFGCLAKGDIFEFYQQYYKLSFTESIERIVGDFNLDIQVKTYDAKAANTTGVIYEVLQGAQKVFLQNLTSNEIQYLTQKRKLKPETIKHFGIGFCPFNMDLKQYFPHKDLESAGLLSKSYCRFSDRLTIPIKNKSGKIVGFGGRLLKQSDYMPKYLNSPETDVFKKSYILYNMDQAFATKDNFVVVTEGYFDVIKLHQYGIKNAVAPMGTNITQSHIKMLKNSGKGILFLFDSDTAGVNASIRAAKMCIPFLDASFEVRFFTLPQGYKDIDELIDSEIAFDFKSRISTFIDYVFRYYASLCDLKNPQENAKLQSTMSQMISQITDSHIQKTYTQYVKSATWKLQFGHNIQKKAKIPPYTKSSKLLKIEQTIAKLLSGISEADLEEISEEIMSVQAQTDELRTAIDETLNNPQEGENTITNIDTLKFAIITHKIEMLEMQLKLSDNKELLMKEISTLRSHLPQDL